MPCTCPAAVVGVEELRFAEATCLAISVAKAELEVLTLCVLEVEPEDSVMDTGGRPLLDKELILSWIALILACAEASPSRAITVPPYQQYYGRVLYSFCHPWHCCCRAVKRFHQARLAPFVPLRQ